MSIQDLGALGELLAAIATVATLIYLATQIRQNTRSNETNAIDMAMSGYAQVNQTLTDPTIASIYRRGMNDPSCLSDDELVQFFAFNRMWTNSLDKMLVLFEKGVLPAHIWVQVASQADQILSSKGGEAVKESQPSSNHIWDAIEKHSDKSNAIHLGFENKDEMRS